MTKTNVEQMDDADVAYCKRCGGLVSTVFDIECLLRPCSCPHCGENRTLCWVLSAIDQIPPGMRKEEEE